MPIPIKDRTGLRHAKLVVTGPSNPNRKPGEPNLWNCQCDCGNVIQLCGRELTPVRLPKSCGCAKAEMIGSGAMKRRMPKTSTLNAQYRCHLMSARKRETNPLPRDLWEIIASQPCHYCGKTDLRTTTPAHTGVNKDLYNPPSQEVLEAYNVYVNGIDRVDSDRGYEPDNCVSCCRHCNVMKNGYTRDEFFQQIKGVYEKHRLDLVTSQPVPYRSTR